MEKKQMIFCNVFDCIHCDSTHECCKLNSIKVSNHDQQKYYTMCENFKRID